jgi:hypothetical protein
MNLNKLYIDHGVKWGIIQFAIVAAIYFTMYFIDVRFAVTTGLWITMPISIALLVVQGLQARPIGGGVLAYGDAFKTLFIAALVSSILFVASGFIIKAYIAPEKAEEEKIVNIENAVKGMEKWNFDEDKIDLAVEKMQEKDAKPTLVDTLLGLVFFVFFDTILVLIIAIFVKKKPKDGEVIAQEQTT